MLPHTQPSTDIWPYDSLPCFLYSFLYHKIKAKLKDAELHLQSNQYSLDSVDLCFRAGERNKNKDVLSLRLAGL